MTTPRQYFIKAGHYRAESGEYVAAVSVSPLLDEAAALFLAQIMRGLVHSGLSRIEAAGPTRKA